MSRPVAQSHEGERFRGIHRIPADIGYESNVLESREAGNQVVELKNKPDMIPTVLSERCVSRRCEVVVEKAHRAARGCVQPAEDIQECNGVTFFKPD